MTAPFINPSLCAFVEEQIRTLDDDDLAAVSNYSGFLAVPGIAFYFASGFWLWG